MGWDAFDYYYYEVLFFSLFLFSVARLFLNLKSSCEGDGDSHGGYPSYHILPTYRSIVFAL